MTINWDDIFAKYSSDLVKTGTNLLLIVLVFLVAKVLLNSLSKITGGVIEKAKGAGESEKSKELITTMTLLRSVCRYVIYFIALCISINILGFGSVAFNMVAAAGIGAIIVSMGAQSIIGDMFAGLFIMFERQYAVGDYVKINNYEGDVTSLAMRCTYLMTRTGERVIIPNGEIRTVINYTVKKSSAIVTVPTPYEADTEEIMKVLREVASQYAKEHPDICCGEPEVTGISAFNTNSVDITVCQPTKGKEFLRVSRELRLAIKKRFDQEGISIPFTQIVIHQKAE